MTENEWLTCADPVPMLAFLRGKASDRKMRLFAIACCQSSRQLIRNAGHRRALSVAARYADGRATYGELAAAYEQANGLACGMYGTAESEREIRRWAEATAVANAVGMAGENKPMAGYAEDTAWMVHRASHRDPNGRLADLIRDVCGNPFRFAMFDPERRSSPGLTGGGNRCGHSPIDPAWQTLTVVGLAEAVYEDHAFDRLPVLADALEEAGCDDPDILSHCRSVGQHVRGCWVVDFVLGKE